MPAPPKFLNRKLVGNLSIGGAVFCLCFWFGLTQETRDKVAAALIPGVEYDCGHSVDPE